MIVEADAFKEKDDIYKALNSTTVQLGRDHNEGLESAETVCEDFQFVFVLFFNL